MWLLYLAVGIPCAYIIFLWLQGSRALSALESGKLGEFTITGVSSNGENYLAADRHEQRLALVNWNMPLLDSHGFVYKYYQSSVILNKDDIESVACSVNIKEKTGRLYIKTSRPIPEDNVDRTLSMFTGPGIEVFFKNHVPWLELRYSEDKASGLASSLKCNT